MNHQKTSYQENPAAPVEPPDAPDWRSSLYAVLARGFSYPDDTVIEFFGQAGQVQAGKKIAQPLASLFEEARATDPEELRRAYLALFDPINGPFPYEVEHRQVEDFSKAHILADIMGFYRVFGVEPRDDRPDHIAAELEFMHLLTLKHSRDLEAGRPERAAQCQDAQQKFLRDHLLVWIEPLLEAMRVRPGADSLVFYRHLMAVLESFMQGESEELA